MNLPFPRLFFSSRPDSIMGIDADGFAVQLRRKQSGPEWVKPLDLNQINLRSFYIASGLKASDVLIRTVKMELKKKREILQALPFQAEALLPGALEHFLIKPIFRQGEVGIIAAPKAALEIHLASLSENHIDPDLVSCAPLALWRFMRHFLPDQRSLFGVHMGTKENILIAIEEGDIKLSLSFVGESDQELERVFAYARKKHPLLTKFVATGKPFPLSLSKIIPSASDLEELLLPSQAQELSLYALAVGYAFEAQKADVDTAQFRQGALLSVQERSRKKGAILRYLGVCTLLFGLVFCGTRLDLRRRAQAIRTIVQEPVGRTAYEAVAAAEVLLADQKKKLVPRSSLPKVGDLLSWISTSPLFTSKEGEFRLDELRMQMVGESSNSAAQRMQVELYLHAPSPAAARSFKEALRTDTQLIDQTSEIKCILDQERIKTTFLLKGRE